MIKAMRDIYPLSSKRERRQNRIAICGRKVRTPPTPPMTPSTRRLSIHTGESAASSKLETKGEKMSPISVDTPSCSRAPSVENVSVKIRNMISRKIGIAKILCVTTASIFSVAVFFPRLDFTTAFATIFSMYL